MGSIEQLHQLNQSLWYDNIERKLLKNGEIARMIQAGEIRGVTSNPSIFQNAIAKSNDYDDALQAMSWANWDAEDMFYQLAVEDIQDTADLFQPLFKKSGGNDGFVSLEVSPKLAYDASGTFEQALKLWKWVDRPNLMIKIPATREGLLAIRQSIAAGLNINVTLIFSVDRYAEVMDAYLSGLEDRLKSGLPIENINSVASFFVSRVDSKIDDALELQVEKGKLTLEKMRDLRGKAAIANSKIAYILYENFFSSDRARKVLGQGGKAQRPLWASTSTKNPDYSDVMYVENLIAENSVNTVPPKTLVAFRDHGNAKMTIHDDLEDAKQFISNLPNWGIHMEEVTQQLEDEGVVAFANAFSGLLVTIDDRKAEFQKRLGSIKNGISKRIQKLDQNHTMARIFSKDASLWTKDSQSQLEVVHRLGWLQAPYAAEAHIPMLERFHEEINQQGFTHVLLLGMGGSSLAPEVLALTSDNQQAGLSLAILDSTDPRQVLDALEKVEKEKTLFVVASKSGSTSEVQANLAFFYDHQKNKYGDEVGQRFIAITDPDTSLARQAREMGFSRIFEADPNVGGRYSALTMFGLVPAALIGMDLKKLIDYTIDFAQDCQPSIPAGRNPGLVLGAVLAEAHQRGKNKMTILADEPYKSFGSWLEQLVAESSGKEGQGLIPVDLEPIVDVSSYGQDRIFVYLRKTGAFQTVVEQLLEKHHPVLIFDISTHADLGQEFYRWELATSVACSEIGVNAFDQPNVQGSKLSTQEKIAHFKETGSFSLPEMLVKKPSFSVNATFDFRISSEESIRSILDSALEITSPGWTIAINAFLPRNQHNFDHLQGLRKTILLKTGCATTLGFGPRFLHSTGQLQKGGPQEMLMVMISDQPQSQVPIPGWGLGFEDLIFAQALGDYEALLSQKKNAIWFHLMTASIQDLYRQP